MALSVTELNNVKVYNLTSGKTLPEWLAQKNRTSLKKDEEYRRRIELLQDFEFNTAAQSVRMTPDGEYCVAVGTYPPMVKVFEVDQLTIKFERHLDSEVVAFNILGDSWGKLAFLHVDRTVEFHAPYGRHYRTRIPVAGRDMLYHDSSCDLYISASSPDVYRLNLEEGRFMTPLTSSSPAVNVLAQTQHLQLLATGGEDGVVECWDLRSNKRAGVFNCGASLGAAAGSGGVAAEGSSVEVTALSFAPGAGMDLAVGTSSGQVAVFDLRSTTPRLVKEHQYGDPIVRVTYHATPSGHHILSADKHVIKIWDRDTGAAVTNIEPPGGVNDFCLVPEKKATPNVSPAGTSAHMDGDAVQAATAAAASTDGGARGPASGVVLVAGEQPRMMAFYVPDLGVAPYWCSFLDSLTEELEESGAGGHIYEDYKFVTRDELKRLSLQHLIGTPLLKTYMHGFFMHAKLHARLMSVADPFAYERWKKEQVQRKIKERRKSRITMRRRLPAVNKDLAEQLMEQEEKGEGGGDAGGDKSSKQGRGGDAELEQPQAGVNPMADPRFAALFTNPDFQIDPENDDYKRRHGGSAPKSSAAARRRSAAMASGDSDGEDTAGGLGDLFQAADSHQGGGAASRLRLYEASAVLDTSAAGAANASSAAAGVGLGGAADVKAVKAARAAATELAAPLVDRVTASEHRHARSAKRRRRARRVEEAAAHGTTADTDGAGAAAPKAARGKQTPAPAQGDEADIGWEALEADPRGRGAAARTSKSSKRASHKRRRA